jgi:hypothetical protein
MRVVGAILRLVMYIALGAVWGFSPQLPAEDSAVPSAALAAEISEAMDHCEPLWESMRSDIVSCEVRFRKIFRVKPVAPLTRDQVLDLLKRHDLGEHPDRTPHFLREVAGPDVKIEAPTRHLYVQGQHRKHDLGQLTYVTDDNFSLVHDGDNKQVHVYERGRNPASHPGLETFRAPLLSRAEGYLPDRAEREGSLLRLITVTAAAGTVEEIQTTNTIDWATGVVLSRLRRMNGEILQEVNYSGLTTFAGGITIPRCVLTARYAKGSLQNLDLALLDEARINEAIPESIFVVSKPEGWPLLDFREQASGAGIPVPQGQVDDARTLIPSFALNPPGPDFAKENEARSLPVSKRTLLVLNGLALIALGLWMWKRASLKEPSH